MFIPYWPVLALVVTVILVGVFLTLFVAEKVCRGAVRHKALPERPLDTYLPEQENPEANLYEEFHLASAELPGAEGQQEQLQQGQDGGFEEVQVEQVPTQEQQHAPPASGTFEQGMPYNLDASMSPEGRREFERY